MAYCYFLFFIHQQKEGENPSFCFSSISTKRTTPTGALDSKAARMLLESFERLNWSMQATILMVTHDAFTASYADRILFIKDGKIFNELVKGTDSRKTFFNKIIEVVTLLGGELNDVI